MIKNEFKTLEKHIKELEALRRYPRVKQERDSLAMEVAHLREKVTVLESEASTHNELSSQLSKREVEINELAGKLAEARKELTSLKSFKVKLPDRAELTLDEMRVQFLQAGEDEIEKKVKERLQTLKKNIRRRMPNLVHKRLIQVLESPSWPPEIARVINTTARQIADDILGARDQWPEVEKTAKRPWQDIHLQGEVEARYIYATMLSRQLLPFGFTGLSLVVLPLEDSPTGIRLVKKEAALAKGHWGLHGWLSQAEALWNERRKERSPVDVYSRLDYQRLLTFQHLTGYYTVLYSRMGTNLACAVISSEVIPEVMGLAVTGFVTEWTSYFYQTKNEKEADYLSAFLNSSYVDQAIKPYQTRGAWGERDISRTPFEAVPIPRFNPEDERHRKLAELSQACHEKVAQLSLEGKSIGLLRNKVRKYLSQELGEIDKLVRDILI